MKCHAENLSLEAILAILFHRPAETMNGLFLASMGKIQFLSLLNTCYWMVYRLPMTRDLKETMNLVLPAPELMAKKHTCRKCAKDGKEILKRNY